MDIIESFGQEIPRVRHEKGDLAYWADAALIVERVRVAAQVRIAHLAKTGRRSPDTESFLGMVKDVEAFADGRLSQLIVNHPTWPWASRIKGVGRENYPKPIGLIEAFGRHYDPGDPKIPPFVTREPEAYKEVEKGQVVDKVGVWVEGIERLALPSKLFKYEGLDVEETGKAPKRLVGSQLGFNSDLRMAWFRLATSILRAGSGPTEKALGRTAGIWYIGSDEDGYSRGYVGHRRVITAKKEALGYKIVPTPKERMCLNCNIAVTAKKAKYCPQCHGPLTRKDEPPGVLFLGHVHQMAMRAMLKDFTLCVWLVWREALGLPVPPPYNVARLGEKPIDPWKMVDKP
jgi:hypothetical protein